MATMSQRYRVIGTRPIRHDGIDKVTGRAKYGGDVHMPDLLESAMLRSPYAHARIKAIDTSKAVTFPGVKAIITGADMPHAQGNANYEEVNADPVMISENCMARSKVLYKGHAVAAVAAVDKHTAEIAAGLIAVDYEPLPAVLDVRESMKDSAPILHDDQSMMTRGFSAGAGRPEKPSNIGSCVKMSSSQYNVTRSQSARYLVPSWPLRAPCTIVVLNRFRSRMGGGTLTRSSHPVVKISRTLV